MVDLSMTSNNNNNNNTSSAIPKNESIVSFHVGEMTLTEIITNSMKNSPTDGSLTSSKLARNAIDAEKPRGRMDRRAAAYSMELTMADMSRRLNIRKRLHGQLTIVSDIMCALAMSGIILMIIANELTFDRVDNHDTKGSWWCKLFISISTGLLLILLCYYHYLDLKLYSNQNSLQDHRIGLTNTKLVFIVMELMICAVHPMPRAYPYTNPPKMNYDASDIIPHPLDYTATDVGLGLPMFLRLYLFGRSILFHSSLVRNASLRSFGYLNRVSIDFHFLIKTGLEQWPGRCLLTCCALAFLIGSWCLRASCYTSTNQHLRMGDSMWLFIVTYATIGYGDIVPSTYYGRTIGALVGIMGLLSSALLINVLAQKLIFSRGEKYVHTFVLNTVLAKERQHEAANVIKYAIQIWILKRRTKGHSLQCIQKQRKLFRSVACLQGIKIKQKNLINNCVGLHELLGAQQNMSGQFDDSAEQMMQTKSYVKAVEKKLNTMAQSISNLETSMEILLKNFSKTVD